MTSAPSLHSLVEEALAHIPALSRHLLDATQDELERVPAHFPLLESWRRLRGRFAADFEAALRPALELAPSSSTPQPVSKPMGMDALGLVDERQALQDVAIAQVIHAIEDLCKSELHQLGNFFAALHGTARARKDDNPVRPALFAQALFEALAHAGLDAEGRYALMRACAQPVAQSLLTVYRSLCEQLHKAELTELVASHAADKSPSERRLRVAGSVLSEVPATLAGLSRADARAHVSSTGAGASPDMLTRLYAQILADPRLQPPVAALLERLRLPVVRLAGLDASLLRREDHPAWQLLNRVASHSMAFERESDERLQVFLRFVEGEAQSLLQASLPSASLFTQLLRRINDHISSQAQARNERSAAALRALEREQMRGSWRQLLREQIDEQIAGAPLGPLMRRFMQQSWVEVIVQAMVLHGKDSAEALTAMGFVDQLLASLVHPTDETQRRALHAALPGLIAQLQAGCVSMAMTPEQSEPVLQELMQTHASLARGQVPRPAAPAAELPSPREPSPEERLQQLLSERESQMPQRWGRGDVDRASLPTVAMPLLAASEAQQAAIQQWVDGVQLGGWFHMFIQSDWLTAQLAWVSDSRQFFLFIGQDADERHSLTRGAIEQLFANGLIAALEEQGLVQKALSTLMQDLDHAD